MLAHRIRLFVPSNIRGRVDLAYQADITRRCCHALAERFGGATVLPAQGYWVGESGLVAEEIRIIEVFGDDIDALAAVGRELAECVAVEMDQEAVSLDVDGTLEFVTQPVRV